MVTDLTTTERSRRGVLAAAAVAAAAAAVAASVARINPVLGADGDEAIIGADNSADTVTRFLTEGAWALSGESVNGRGLNGQSEAGQGVHGESMLSAGVAGKSDEGNGVHGTSRLNRGVWGESTFGPGVDATGATGVRTASPEGYALHTVTGRVRFDVISGIAEIPPGEKSLTVPSPVPVSKSTFVLLTPQTNLGGRSFWYTKDTDAQTLTVHITSEREKGTKLAYLILEQAPAS
jgi:hypothetical protein